MADTPVATPDQQQIQSSLQSLKNSVSDGALKDYANPKAAITIGASSAMVISFTATLCSSFPVLPSALTALALSVMFGTAQVIYINEKVLSKVFYGFVVAMLIFHTARGGNQTLSDAAGPKAPPAAEIVIPKTVEAQPWNFSLVPSAYASDVNTNSAKASTNEVEKFYLSYMGKDGFPVYTNRVGASYVDRSYKKGTFSAWSFR